MDKTLGKLLLLFYSKYRKLWKMKVSILPEILAFKLTDRSKEVLLLWIIFVIFVSCLSCFLVCSLQLCDHLQGKG